MSRPALLEQRVGSGRGDRGQGRIGRVWLVGAGPGDPELITLKARRLVAAADVVVYDRLVAPEVLDHAPPGAIRMAVGKAGHAGGTPQRDINELLVRLARAGRSVVRLKGGDPYVFGRGGEEAVALRRAGVPFEVVPGVTAGVAGPAYAGIPVTHRGLSRSVVFVTGHSDPACDAPATDWVAIARIDTIVVFMAGRNGPAIAARLIAAGRVGSTPAAVIRRASLPTQAVRLTDLTTLAAEPPDDPHDGPTLLLVGAVVTLAPELDWLSPPGVAADRPTTAQVLER